MSGAESALPETLTAGRGFGDAARSVPSNFAVAGVMPSVVAGAGPSIADGVGPIALFESSVVLANAMLVPSEAGVAPNGDCAKVAPPHPVASRTVSDVLTSRRGVVLMTKWVRKSETAHHPQKQAYFVMRGRKRSGNFLSCDAFLHIVGRSMKLRRMNDALPMIVGALTIGISVVVMVLLVKGQSKKAAAVIAMIKTRGPRTLDEVAAATGTSFVMKGYLMQALDGMVAQQTLTKIPPPPDHPRMRIFRDTKYGLPPTA
jgi:hypothetical protein